MLSHLFHLCFWRRVSEKAKKISNETYWEKASKEILRSWECWISLSVNAKIMDYHEYCINYNICDRKRDSLGGRMLSTHRIWEAGTEHRGTSTQKGTGMGRFPHLCAPSLPLFQMAFSVSFLGSWGRRRCFHCYHLSAIHFLLVTSKCY